MGADYHYSKIYIGKESPELAKERIVDRLHNKLIKEDFAEIQEEILSNWSYLLIDDADSWLHFGEWGKNKVMEEFPLYLSADYPIIHINVSDSAAVRFTLYEKGQLVDQYANMDFPFFMFKSKDIANQYSGQVAYWERFLALPNSGKLLQETWAYPATVGIQKTNNKKFHPLMTDTIKLFGWDKSLSEIGYTYNEEGLPESGIEYLFRYHKSKYTFLQKHYQYQGKDNPFQTIKDYLDS